MISGKLLIPLAVIFVQLLGAIECRVYDTQDTWIASDRTVALPERAILSGFTPNGDYSYVGRVMYNSNALPARIIQELGRATYNTESLSSFATSYQVLVANETVSYRWVRSYNGHVEKNAVSVGTSSTSERLFICRYRSDGGLLMGTLYPSLAACYIKYDDLLLRRFEKYEILVRDIHYAQFTPFEVAERSANSNITN